MASWLDDINNWAGGLWDDMGDKVNDAWNDVWDGDDDEGTQQPPKSRPQPPPPFEPTPQPVSGAQAPIPQSTNTWMILGVVISALSVIVAIIKK